MLFIFRFKCCQHFINYIVRGCRCKKFICVRKQKSFKLILIICIGNVFYEFIVIIICPNGFFKFVCAADSEFFTFGGNHFNRIPLGNDKGICVAVIGGSCNGGKNIRKAHSVIQIKLSAVNLFIFIAIELIFNHKRPFAFYEPLIRKELCNITRALSVVYNNRNRVAVGRYSAVIFLNKRNDLK